MTVAVNVPARTQEWSERAFTALMGVGATIIASAVVLIGRLTAGFCGGPLGVCTPDAIEARTRLGDAVVLVVVYGALVTVALVVRAGTRWEIPALASVVYSAAALTGWVASSATTTGAVVVGVAMLAAARSVRRAARGMPSQV